MWHDNRQQGQVHCVAGLLVLTTAVWDTHQAGYGAAKQQVTSDTLEFVDIFHTPRWKLLIGVFGQKHWQDTFNEPANPYRVHRTSPGKHLDGS